MKIAETVMVIIVGMNIFLVVKYLVLPVKSHVVITGWRDGKDVIGIRKKDWNGKDPIKWDSALFGCTVDRITVEVLPCPPLNLTRIVRRAERK